MYLCFIISLSGAFMDVVIDGICCVQQRLDPQNGAQDLQTLSWVFLGIGSIFASLTASIMIDILKLGEKSTFLVNSAITFFVLFNSYCMS